MEQIVVRPRSSGRSYSSSNVLLPHPELHPQPAMQQEVFGRSVHGYADESVRVNTNGMSKGLSVQYQ